MNKIGATKSGTVIVEMTTAQFDALHQFMVGQSGAGATKLDNSVAVPVPVIALKRKLEYVRGCLEKLKPASHEELLRSIKSVFRSFGGIADFDVEQIVKILQKEGFIAIDELERVTYAMGEAKAPAVESVEKKVEATRREREPLISS